MHKNPSRDDFESWVVVQFFIKILYDMGVDFLAKDERLLWLHHPNAPVKPEYRWREDICGNRIARVTQTNLILEYR